MSSQVEGLIAAANGVLFGGAYQRFFKALSEGDPFSWSLVGVLVVGGIAWYKVKTWRSERE